MSKYEKAEVNLLPRAEGLLLGTIGGMELENFNREGAILTLYKTVELIREAAALLRQQGEESNTEEIWNEVSQIMTLADLHEVYNILNQKYEIKRKG
jgi:hypothetical protein